jgi:transposase InsO family protein
MGSKGSAYDNVVAESFFSNLKNELVHHADFSNQESARAAIFSYIELFYNRQRIHQRWGMSAWWHLNKQAARFQIKLSGKCGLAQPDPFLFTLFWEPASVRRALVGSSRACVAP